MRARAKREFSRNWPIMGICLVMWVSTVILRTPAVGFDFQRVAAIAATSGSMLVLGMMIERIRRINQEEEDQ